MNCVQKSFCDGTPRHNFNRWDADQKQVPVASARLVRGDLQNLSQQPQVQSNRGPDPVYATLTVGTFRTGNLGSRKKPDHRCLRLAWISRKPKFRIPVFQGLPQCD